jgi:hypothetical protein
MIGLTKIKKNHDCMIDKENNNNMDFDTTSQFKLQETDVILCHTPFKTLVDQYKDKYVLISGSMDIPNHQNIIDIALNYGYEKVLSVHEYSGSMSLNYQKSTLKIS